MAGEKIHTTNYFDTLIKMAEDCPALCGTLPPARPGKRSIAEMQYELLAKHPYVFTSDDIFFQVFAQRNDLSEAEHEAARTAYFSKGQPCFRSSPLTQPYGFGIHADAEGKVALYGVETEAYRELARSPHPLQRRPLRLSWARTEAYRELARSPHLKKVKAMRSARK